MTDAAMAERAECVMLNKRPFIAEAIAILDDVLTRMEAHQLKKTPQLRALHSAPTYWGRYAYAIEVGRALLDFGFSEHHY